LPSMRFVWLGHLWDRAQVSLALKHHGLILDFRLLRSPVIVVVRCMVGRRSVCSERVAAGLIVDVVLSELGERVKLRDVAVVVEFDLVLGKGEEVIVDAEGVLGSRSQ